MMALRLLPIIQVIIILCSPTFAYPVYGTKRYGRGAGGAGVKATAPVAAAAATAPNSAWGGQQQHMQGMMRAQRYPVNYYEMYPYNQNYADDYYYPDAMNYPVYYPPARTSKYEVYQAVLPYYYDRPVMQPNYGYYGYDDAIDEEQENDREQREESQPIGQEMYYENDGDENLNAANAAFLQNLIMTQMYKDQLNKQYNKDGGLDKQPFKDGLDMRQYPTHNQKQAYEKTYESDDPTQYGLIDKQYAKDSYDVSNEDFYDKLDDYSNKQNYFKDDEDEFELKQLVKPTKIVNKPSSQERLNWFQRSSANKSNNKQKGANNNKQKGNDEYYWEEKRAFDLKKDAFIDRKIKVINPKTTQAPATSIAPKRDQRGMKEEVLLRPATPVKHPFAASIMNMMHKKDYNKDRPRIPSVYDTIKHMLDIEKSLDHEHDVLKPVMRKRIISSEDSLTRQLSVLKKQK